MRYRTTQPFFSEREIASVLSDTAELLRSGGPLSMASNVERFESAFAEVNGSEYAVATNSCTSALETVLTALQLRDGDEVLVPAQTFIATASSVARVGATPVFCEVDENFLLDIDALGEHITPRTRAVILVHFAGLIHQRVADFHGALKELGLTLITDAAHAHGAHVAGTPVGAVGDVACFSFYSSKIVSAGEGGMITTSDAALADRCRSLRSRGLDLQSEEEVYSSLGTNSRMTEIQAILGLHQLSGLTDRTVHRNKVADRYSEELQPLVDSGVLRLLPAAEGSRHAYWRFVAVLSPDAGLDREQLKHRLGEEGIAIDWPYQPLVHLQPIMRQLFGTRPGQLPRSEALAEQHFCLPMHSRISLDDARVIASAVVSAVE